METEITNKITYNKTKDKIYKLSCKICDRKTNHMVLSAVENYWSAGDDVIQGIDKFEIVSCCGCDEISFRFSSTNSEDTDFDGTPIEDEVVYPNRVVGRRKISEIYFLPNLVLKIYKETHGALSGKFNILASIGICVLVEAICKNCKAIGPNLEHKINNLVTMGIFNKNKCRCFTRNKNIR